ncbi:MAG: pantoate--beta-alanine ligase [bacterium]|nr:pantoate--beta-alanine ligase [bacterium]
MQCIDRIADLRRAVKAARQDGRKIGLVPTMGALHRGHAALIAQAAEDSCFTVVSIFINPAQFGPNEDLDLYPRTLERDLQVAAEAGADLVFAPVAAEIYPSGFNTWVEVGGSLTDCLCGAFRPGHFRGVATIVLKLFNMTDPDQAYFGEKDYQQLQVVRRFVQDLNLPLKIMPLPTVREADGLAMSSRNKYLSPEERSVAPWLYKALRAAAEAATSGEGDIHAIRCHALEIIASQPALQLEYLEIVDSESLQPLHELCPGAVMLAAARLGNTRLIDNIKLI